MSSDHRHLGIRETSRAGEDLGRDREFPDIVDSRCEVDGLDLATIWPISGKTPTAVTALTDAIASSAGRLGPVGERRESTSTARLSTASTMKATRM
jgi:hypothetical protein